LDCRNAMPPQNFGPEKYVILIWNIGSAMSFAKWMDAMSSAK